MPSAVTTVGFRRPGSNYERDSCVRMAYALQAPVPRTFRESPRSIFMVHQGVHSEYCLYSILQMRTPSHRKINLCETLQLDVK